MNTFVLRALRGDDPLGFLAALGVVELLRSELMIPEDDLGLSWEGVGGPARLTAPLRGIDDLIAGLVEAARRMHADGRLVPARLPEIIPAVLSDDERARIERDTGVEPPFDSIRMTRTESIARFSGARAASISDLRWLCALVDQISTFPQEQDAHVTPLYAPVARQRLRQLYSKELEAVVEQPQLLREACMSWRRNPGDKGVNLDRRAQRDSAVTTWGKPQNAAVTGAEWLALQSAAWFRLGGTGARPFAWGWLPTRPGGRPRALVWPVWEPTLDPHALEVLITHPAVRAAARGDETLASDDLRRLGVLAVLKAERATLANSDGPLGPSTVLWPQRARIES